MELLAIKTDHYAFLCEATSISKCPEKPDIPKANPAQYGILSHSCNFLNSSAHGLYSKPAKAFLAPKARPLPPIFEVGSPA